jgi:hypothetical protein
MRREHMAAVVRPLGDGMSRRFVMRSGPGVLAALTRVRLIGTPDAERATPTQHTLQSGMHLYPIDGAAGRVPQDATAWNWRGARWAQVMAGISRDPADNEQMIAWARSY